MQFWSLVPGSRGSSSQYELVDYDECVYSYQRYWVLSALCPVSRSWDDLTPHKRPHRCDQVDDLGLDASGILHSAETRVLRCRAPSDCLVSAVILTSCSPECLSYAAGRSSVVHRRILRSEVGDILRARKRSSDSTAIALTRRTETMLISWAHSSLRRSWLTVEEAAEAEK